MDLTFALDETSSLPLYQQLYLRLVDEITAGRLSAGARLPSRRVLASHLGISQQTVLNASDLLLSEGYVHTKARQGLYVADILPMSPVRAARPRPLPQKKKEPRFDFSTQGADIRLFPYQIWARLIREVLYQEPWLMSKGDARGEGSLREALGDFLYQYRGAHCQAEDVVIGSGVDQLLGVLGQLIEKKQLVACEDPGYPEAALAFLRAGHKVAHLPLDEQGMQMDALAASGASLAYLTPAHQFPTGISMPAGRRSEMLRWAQAREGRYLIEDDYDSEFRYQSRPLPALQGMDGGRRTIYIGTFSRSLAPGIRVAYMALPPDLSARYQALGLRSGDAVSRFEQRALARLVAEGHYSRHLRRAGSAYQRRIAQLSQALEQLPGLRLRGQQAGLHFLLEVAGQTEEELIQKAADAGIPLRGLSEFCQQAILPPALVLGFAGLSDEQVAPAALALQTAWGL